MYEKESKDGRYRNNPYTGYPQKIAKFLEDVVIIPI